jgi:hypothetical protein
MRNFILYCCFQNTLCSYYVISHELGWIDSPDLCMCNDESITASKLFLPTIASASRSG